MKKEKKKEEEKHSVFSGVRRKNKKKLKPCQVGNIMNV